MIPLVRKKRDVFRASDKVSLIKGVCKEGPSYISPTKKPLTAVILITKISYTEKLFCPSLPLRRHRCGSNIALERSDKKHDLCSLSAWKNLCFTHGAITYRANVTLCRFFSHLSKLSTSFKGRSRQGSCDLLLHEHRLFLFITHRGRVQRHIGIFFH
jgi:hypothetical protein